MTRTAPINFSGGNNFAANMRPPKELLPANVVTALAAYDDLLNRHFAARVRATALNSDTATAEAEKTDNAAVAAAVAANAPIPAPEAKNALLKALEESNRELQGFDTAIADAENNLRTLTEKAAIASGYDPAKEHQTMLTATKGHLDAANAAFAAFADREVLNAWMISGAPFVPRTAVTVLDVLALERGMMDGRKNVPVREILDGVVNALKVGK
ncbi:hypothetical protein [Arthrobacter sp. U41]|uniref:hypothetical protein n=1 Tax=Arthrobacter sp. U41 TaxID=1849032 RepID=UPI0008595174|nr:hypothetical protein [Arthrobacter sp. U41]AOT04939.1 hypothetical protein ASPU41_18075 [Arthrobacter sp. U41]